MGYYATASAPQNLRREKLTCSPKTASRDFFATPTDRIRENRLSTRTSTKEKTPCTYETASGLPYWPSRDPIEEEGGYNLYVFVLNSPPQYYDARGEVAQWVAGCGVGAAWGGIGGFLGGIGGGWRSACCGGVTGAMSGCAAGAICASGVPALCTGASCFAGFVGSIANNFCQQGIDSVTDKCTWASAIWGGALGCLGGFASEADAKAELISWVLGVNVSAWSSLCGIDV
ncbi:MAG: hypothetical protein ACNA77_11240 [Opitutales bacterium]